MPESLVQVTEGTGKKLHTWQRTIGANSVEDEVVILGHPYEAAYTFEFSNVSTGTAASHILQIMAGASLNVYIHRITLWQMTAATTAAFCEWSVRRLSTAGTGGTSKTAGVLDASDAAAGATGMILPTAKGTEGSVPWRQGSYMTQTPGAGAVNILPLLDFRAELGVKPIRIGSGTANGIAIRNDTAIAGATVTGIVVLTEASF